MSAMIDPAKLLETERYLHEQIPMARAMGIRVEGADGGGFVLSAALEKNHNHLGTAFGGSLAAIAVLAGYGLLWLELDDPRAHVVVRESRIGYLRPVTGDLRAVCARPDEAALADFKATFAKAGKARIRLEVTIGENGGTCVVASGVYVALRS